MEEQQGTKAGVRLFRMPDRVQQGRDHIHHTDEA